MIYESTTLKSTMSKYMTRMFLKVGVSVIATFLISFSLAMFLPKSIVGICCSLPGMLLICISEVVIITIISNKVKKINLDNINLFFSLFVLINSLSLNYIYFYFSMSEIIFAAGAAGLFFLSMGLYGYFTKKDLSSWTATLNAALMSILVISIVHFIIALFTSHVSSLIEILLSIAMIVVVSLYTAHNMNKYKNFYLQNHSLQHKEGMVTLGALSLYLDYIIIFKHILRLMRYMHKNNK